MSSESPDPVDMHVENWPESWDGRVQPFIYALHRVREQHMRRTESICARYGLTPSELDVLATLRRSPHPWVLTPSELRQSVLITSGGLAKVLQQLESRGLVARLADRADRRVKPVQLTAEALPIIEGVVGELLSQARAWLSGRLSDQEIEQAAALLKKLADEPKCR